MKIIDPGHIYELRHLDGMNVTRLVFGKREGEMYPGNVGSHEGTNIQEVLRAVINRLKYVDAQIPDEANSVAIRSLREALIALEIRASYRHGKTGLLGSRIDLAKIEEALTCNICGHVYCDHL